MNYGKHIVTPAPKATNQRSKIPGCNQVQNSAGGFVFKVDDWTRLERFLVLGTEGGTYYASERKITRTNAKVVERLLKEDGITVVNTIVGFSTDGRAPKNDPAIFALAMALKLGDAATKSAAKKAVPRVCRTGTHLFHLAENIKAFGGWGRGTQAAFEGWYNSMPAEKLALQAVKYQQRDGWSHRDILRKVHLTPQHDRVKILEWMVRGAENIRVTPPRGEVEQVIWAFEKAKTARGKDLVRLIEQYNLPHECVPNEAKGDPAVWEAMLPSMGITALIRNLGKMTSIGLLRPMTSASTFVREQLNNEELIKKGRVHPLQVLLAQRVYVQGHGDKGSLTWTPDNNVTNALNSAFYLAFKSIEPTGKRTLLALDVSGSMAQGEIAGMSGITPRIGSAAMALVTARVEPEHYILGFTGGSYYDRNSGALSVLNISPDMRLDSVVQKISGLPMGPTDCSLPMRHAQAAGIDVDTFVVYTDNETWSGSVHPCQALKNYRQARGIPAKLIVVGMTATECSIADPSDGGMMDVTGFDTAAPSIMSQFSARSL
jgi:60 kDa SS-A/Ro ribonucleoprotein